MRVTSTQLRSLPLFNGCDPADLDRVVGAITETREIAEGDVICAEGDKADRWWIVADGVADVTVGGLYTASIGAGETIGELGLLDGEPRGATVKAASEMVLHEVDGHQFIDALLASPSLAVALLRELAVRLRTTNIHVPRPVTGVPTRSTPRTATPAGAAASEFDPRTAAYHDDPQVHLRDLREARAAHWSDAVQSYVITRYEDVHRLARSRAVVGSVTTLDVNDASDCPFAQGEPRRGYKMMIRRDGTDHTRLRRLMAKVFTPRAISDWQERAEGIADALLDAMADREEVDVIADYARPLPTQIISDMLGMPTADGEQLRHWTRILTRGLDPFSTPEEQQASEVAGREISQYVSDVVADKRKSHREDILTSLIAAEDEGTVLDTEEIVAQTLLLYIAGHETTMNLIGNGVTHLFRFPEQLDVLRAEPGLDANAIEEVLRFESPAQLTRRVAVEPLEVDDLTIPAGSHLTLLLASANHDPRKWGDTADALDIARPGAHNHVSFGGGVHHCLGASLARLEGKVGLPRLLRRFPRMVPAYDEPDWLPRMTLRGVDTLRVTLR
jgi:cytochrome P450